MEPVRPQVDSYLLDWITTSASKSRVVFGAAGRQLPTDGIVRGPFVPDRAHLGSSCRAVRGMGRASHLVNHTQTRNLFATRLTQANKREARGRPSVPPPKPAPQPENVCRVCGMSVSSGRSYCSMCDVTTARERIVEIAKVGRVASQASGPQARRVETQRLHALAKKAWKPSSLPTWLNEETYTSKIQPRLTEIANPVIMSALGRFSHICHCDPRGQTPPASKALGGAGEIGRYRRHSPGYNGLINHRQPLRRLCKGEPAPPP